MKEILKQALLEDAPKGDITSDAIFKNEKINAVGHLIAKQGLVLSGAFVVNALCAQSFKSIKIKWLAKDGQKVKNKTLVAKVEGPLKDILRFERVALNFLQHLSGIATLTRTFVEKVKLASGGKTEVFDTRKTTPGLRALEKQAVSHGGGKNHRQSLSDQYLIKDNHIKANGSLTYALQSVFAHQKKHGSKKKVVIEVQNLIELSQALMYAVDVILLDNMKPATVKTAVSLKEALSPKTKLEVSGGIVLKNVTRYAKLGVERISVGALTHSAKAVDLSLKIQPAGPAS